MIANRSAARPVLSGSTTLSTAAAATAASIALPPLRMIARPACAASGWLVVTTPCGAMTSERPCAIQPSARSPRTAVQAAALEWLAQTDRAGRPCGHAGAAPKEIRPARAALLMILKFIAAASQFERFCDPAFCKRRRSDGDGL